MIWRSCMYYLRIWLSFDATHFKSALLRAQGCFVTAEVLNTARQRQHLHIVFCPFLWPGTGKPDSLHMTDLKLAAAAAISETQKQRLMGVRGLMVTVVLVLPQICTKTTTVLPGRAVVWNHHTSTVTPKHFRCCKKWRLSMFWGSSLKVAGPTFTSPTYRSALRITKFCFSHHIHLKEKRTAFQGVTPCC